MTDTPQLYYRRHEQDPNEPRALPAGRWIALDPDDSCIVRTNGPTASDPTVENRWVLRLPISYELPPDFEFSGPVHEIGVDAETQRPIYAARIQGTPGSLELVGYRKLYMQIPDGDLALVGRAMQIIDWDDNTQFCSRCGTPTVASAAEAVKTCPECEHTQYARLAPAMIVGVVRDGKLLLAAAPRFRKAFYSILAGFVEPGETAEECVHREVYEETHIRVTNVRYFGSQSWPFPHSFMLGFTAEYQSGEIEIDGEELIDAGWYGPLELPPVPTEMSISGRIIRWFCAHH